MIGQTKHCEICGELASGIIRVELIDVRSGAQQESQYLLGMTHSRCNKHRFGIKSVSVYEGYDYVEVAELEVLKNG